MRAKDFNTIERFLAEYGMKPGVSTPVGSQTSGSTAKATKQKSVMSKSQSNLNIPSQSPTMNKTPKALKPLKPATNKKAEPSIAKDLKKGTAFNDKDGNDLEVVDVVGNIANPDTLVAKNKKGEFVTIDPKDEVTVKEDNSFDKLVKRKNKLKNKIKQILRAQKHAQQGEPVFEINFNNSAVIKSALDANVSCGFEAEVVFPDLQEQDDDGDWLEGESWSNVSDMIYDQEGYRSVSNLEENYREWLQETDYFWQAEDSVIDEIVSDRKTESGWIEEFAGEKGIDDEVDEYKADTLAELEAAADEGGEAEANMLARYESYSDTQWTQEYIEENLDDEYVEWLREGIRDNGEHWDDAWERAQEAADIERWMEDEYGSWYDLLQAHDIYLHNENGAGGVDAVASILEDWANENSKHTDVKAGSYHSNAGDTTQDYWRVEEDSSIEGDGAKAEIISPVYDSPREMLAEMKNLFAWLESHNAETNESTGLHVTMSMRGEQGRENPLKMALLLGDKYLLKSFDREFNSYAKSQQERIKDQIKRMEITSADVSSDELATLEAILTRGIDFGKFSSINFKSAKNDDGNTLIEFRIGGGNDYHSSFEKVAKSAIRYSATLQAGYDPEAYKKDYIRAIMRLVDAAQGGINKAEMDKLEKSAGLEIKQTVFTDLLKSRINRNSYLDTMEMYKQAVGGNTQQGYYIMNQLISMYSNGKFKDLTEADARLIRAMRVGMRDMGVDPQAYIDHLAKDLPEYYNGNIAKVKENLAAAAKALKALANVDVKIPDINIETITLPQGKTLFIQRKIYHAIQNLEPYDISEIKIVDASDWSTVSRAVQLLDTDQNREQLIQMFGNGDEEKAKKSAEELIQAWEKKYGFRPSLSGMDQNPESFVGVNAGILSAALTKNPHQPAHIVKESVFDRFDRLPLAEQLAIISKVDKKKLDEAWSKKYKDSINCSNPKGFSQKAHCAGKKKKTTEGAVPVHNTKRDFDALMCQPLYGWDVKAQMEAYFVVPVPSMVKEFRYEIASKGNQVDLRPVLQRYAQAMLHPTEKKQVGLSEAKITRIDLQKADQPYIDTLISKIQNGEPIGIFGSDEKVVVDPTEADRIASIMFPNGDINQATTKTAGTREIYVPAQPEVFNKEIKIKTDKGEVNLFSLDKDDLKGAKVTYNKGDVAEIMMGAAVVDFFRSAGKPSVEGMKQLLTSGELTQGKTIWTLQHAQEIVHSNGGTDNLEFKLAIRKGSLAPVLEWANSNLNDRSLDNIANSAKAFSEDVSVGAVAEAYKRIVEDKNVNKVTVVTDGVSDQKGTKADLIMSIDNEVYNLLSLKVGDVKQFGQVSGYSYDIISEFFETTFGVNLPAEAPSLEWDTAENSMASFKKIKNKVVSDLKAEFAGGSANDVSIIHRIFQGIKYHATRHEDNVDMVIVGETGNAKYSILSFDDTLFSRMSQINFDIVDENDPAKNSITLKIVGTSGDLLNKYKEKYSGAPVLFQIRMGLIKETKGFYMRNRVEMGPLLKFLADKSWKEENNQ